MIPSLPTELLRSILEQVKGEQDLANCCSTSKSFLHIARPLLYSTIRFYVCNWRDIAGMGPGQSLSKQLNASTIKLIDGLVKSAELRGFVKSLRFEASSDSWSSRRDGGMDDNETLLQVMAQMVALKEIVVADSWRIDKVDELLSEYQAPRHSSESGSSRVTLRFASTRRTQDGRGIASYKASYTTLRFNTDAAWSVNQASTLLKSSKDTLEALTIPFDETALLSDYHQLKYLDLLFAAPGFEEELPSGRELYASLPRLPALETLVLSDFGQDTFPERFPTDPLAHSLPPTLHSLSLQGRFLPTNLSKFVKALPSASTLSRLNIRMDEEELLSKGELEVECEKRGIRLTFDEIWENKI